MGREQPILFHEFECVAGLSFCPAFFWVWAGAKIGFSKGGVVPPFPVVALFSGPPKAPGGWRIPGRFEFAGRSVPRRRCGCGGPAPHCSGGKWLGLLTLCLKLPADAPAGWALIKLSLFVHQPVGGLILKSKWLF